MWMACAIEWKIIRSEYPSLSLVSHVYWNSFSLFFSKQFGIKWPIILNSFLHDTTLSVKLNNIRHIVLISFKFEDRMVLIITTYIYKTGWSMSCGWTDWRMSQAWCESSISFFMAVVCQFALFSWQMSVLVNKMNEFLKKSKTKTGLDVENTNKYTTTRTLVKIIYWTQYLPIGTMSWNTRRHQFHLVILFCDPSTSRGDLLNKKTTTIVLQADANQTTLDQFIRIWAEQPSSICLNVAEKVNKFS